MQAFRNWRRWLLAGAVALAVPSMAAAAPSFAVHTSEFRQAHSAAVVTKGYTTGVHNYGGQVSTSQARVVLVEWGSQWTTQGDPSSEIANLRGFFLSLHPGDGWQSVISAYYQPHVRYTYRQAYRKHVRRHARYRGHWRYRWVYVRESRTRVGYRNVAIPQSSNVLAGMVADVAAPADTSQAGQSIESDKIRSDYHLPASTIVWLMSAPGAFDVMANGYCGIHGVDDNGGLFAYQPYSTDATWPGGAPGGACGAYYAGGPNDGQTLIASHEFAEIRTDGDLLSWQTPVYADGGTYLGNYEIADTCTWYAPAGFVGQYPVTALWSINNACVS